MVGYLDAGVTALLHVLERSNLKKLSIISATQDFLHVSLELLLGVLQLCIRDLKAMQPVHIFK